MNQDPPNPRPLRSGGWDGAPPSAGSQRPQGPANPADVPRRAESVDDDLDARLTRLIESDPDAVADPFPLYQDLLAQAPVYRWGPTVVVAGFDEVKGIARDAVTFSNRGYSVGTRARAIRARLAPHEAHVFDEVAAFEALYISRQDGDVHARLRDIAHRAFTPRKMAELARLTQQFTDDLIAGMVEREETDFVKGVSSRLSVMMINSLLNVPLSDVDLIKGWAARIGKNRGGAVTADLLDAHAALDEFRGYVREIVDHHRRNPTATTLVSALMGASHEERLSDDELLATMVVLLFAGTDTTTALLGNGLHALLSDRDQWELLCSDPTAHMQTAIEELLRYITPVQTTWRVTTAPTMIGGVDVPEGNTVLVLIGAADRDPSVFADPDRLDITRHPNHHLAFWFGAHFCLGASLARMEVRTVLTALATRFPDIELRDAAAPVTWRGNIQFRTIGALDVVMGTDGGVLTKSSAGSPAS